MDQDLEASEVRTPVPRRGTARPLPANREARAHRLRNGRRVGYAEYGDPDGYPVFAFHGTPGARVMFRLADAFAALQGLRLIAADRPGYGLSCATERGGTGPVVEDAATLADALGIDTFAVVGVSGGSPYAVACAEALRDRVRALALVSPVGPVADVALRPQLATAHRLIFLRLAKSDRLSAAAFHFLRFLVARAPHLVHRGILMQAAESDRAILLRPEVKDDLINGLGEGMRPGIAGAVRDLRLFSQDWDRDPGRIGVPCCIWQGDADRTIPPAAAVFLARRIPGCELRMLAGAGHYWIYDHFADVLSWVTERCSLRTRQNSTP